MYKWPILKRKVDQWDKPQDDSGVRTGEKHFKGKIYL